MELIKTLLDIDTVFFSVMGYPMSYIEFFGTVFNILCVYLVSRGKILNWPIGILGSTLYIILFYQIRLYSDVLEQGYFLVTGFVGWYVWWKHGHNKTSFIPTTNRPDWNVWWLMALTGGTLVMYAFVVRLNVWFPDVFSAPAEYPLLDSFTTVASLCATVLLIQKKVEAWVLWIIVDIIGIWLYWVKDVRFISLEYVLFLGLATYGLITYWRAYRENRVV